MEPQLYIHRIYTVITVRTINAMFVNKLLAINKYQCLFIGLINWESLLRHSLAEP